MASPGDAASGNRDGRSSGTQYAEPIVVPIVETPTEDRGRSAYLAAMQQMFSLVDANGALIAQGTLTDDDPTPTWIVQPKVGGPEADALTTVANKIASTNTRVLGGESRMHGIRFGFTPPPLPRAAIPGRPSQVAAVIAGAVAVTFDGPDGQRFSTVEEALAAHQSVGAGIRAEDIPVGLHPMIDKITGQIELRAFDLHDLQKRYGPAIDDHFRTFDHLTEAHVRMAYAFERDPLLQKIFNRTPEQLQMLSPEGAEMLEGYTTRLLSGHLGSRSDYIDMDERYLPDEIKEARGFLDSQVIVPEKQPERTVEQ